MLESISIKDFRNYPFLVLDFAPGDNILAGDNGTGKTNLLEAIYFASLLRSFRTVRWKELVRIGAASTDLTITVRRGNWRQKRRVHFEFPEKRQLYSDSGPISKASEYVQLLRPVVFAPGDRELVTGSAGHRRSFFDMLIALSDQEYWYALRSHNQAMLRRNAALRSGNGDSIKAFESIVAESAIMLTSARKHWTALLNKELEKFSSDAVIHYKSDCLQYTTLSSYMAAFEESRPRDLQYKTTSFGPQRDEFEIIYQEKPARAFASTGQGRLLSLKLKLAQASLMQQYSDTPLAALIDDVTGDLDAKARNTFLQELQIFPQRIYTFTHIPREPFAAGARKIIFSASAAPSVMN